MALMASVLKLPTATEVMAVKAEGLSATMSAAFNPATLVPSALICEVLSWLNTLGFKPPKAAELNKAKLADEPSKLVPKSAKVKP